MDEIKSKRCGQNVPWEEVYITREKGGKASRIASFDHMLISATVITSTVRYDPLTYFLLSVPTRKMSSSIFEPSHPTGPPQLRNTDVTI